MTTGVTVRRMRPHESEVVTRLWEAMGRELPDGGALDAQEWADVRRLLDASADGEDRFCFVAERDGVLVGFVNGEVSRPATASSPRAAEIETCYVTPHLRRTGVGAALATHAMTWLRGLGADPVSLETWMDDADVQAFWAAQGFEPESLRMASYAEPE